MERRRYLAAVAAAALAGCPSQSDEEPTPTATATATPTETPTETDTPTATSTATETATDTATETTTPEATPTAFESAVADAQVALSEMHDAYVSQREGGQSLQDVDAATESFDRTVVWEETDAVDAATSDARAAAGTDAQNATVDDLQAIRRFLYQCAVLQSEIMTKHNAVEDLLAATEDGDADDAETAYEAVSISDFPPTILNTLDDTTSVGSPQAALSVEFMDHREWRQKVDQFEAEVGTVESLEVAVEDLPEAISAGGSHAATDYGQVKDELDSMLDDGVAGSFETVIEELREVVREKELEELARSS